MSSVMEAITETQEATMEIVNQKRPLESDDVATEMNIVGSGGGASPKKVKRVIESSDDEMSGEPTSDVTLTENSDAASASKDFAKKTEKSRSDQYQFERVVLCIQNVRDMAVTLQPGYQLTTKIYRDPQGRYNIVAEEDKSADYHFDIKHPSLNKPTVPKADRKALQVELNAKLNRVQALAREIISSEHITIRLVNDSGENIHLLVNFAQSSKSVASTTAPPVKEKTGKK